MEEVEAKRATKAVAVSEQLRGSDRSNGRGKQTMEVKRLAVAASKEHKKLGGGSDSKCSIR